MPYSAGVALAEESMDRRSFVTTGFSIAGSVVAACALPLPTDVVSHSENVPVIRGTPFTVDVRLGQGTPPARLTGRLLRGSRFEMRRRVTVSTRESGRRQTRTERI
jgi:hypothetical protein